VRPGRALRSVLARVEGPVTRDEALLWGRGVHTRVAIPDEVLALVEERMRGVYCAECRTLKLVTPPDVALEVDHKQALVRGGDNRHENLQWLCEDHNKAMAGRPVAAPRTPAWARRQRWKR
jgi:5-methylcytosine-specific restriction endonuclease McrA